MRGGSGMSDQQPNLPDGSVTATPHAGQTQIPLKPEPIHSRKKGEKSRSSRSTTPSSGPARRHGCILELIPRVGSYLNTEAVVFAVHGGRTPPSTQVLACVDLGRARTLYQDPSFGLRQLVDVATQALSPALNQATTATQVDRLEEVLLRILRRPPATDCFVGADSAVRLVVHPPSWDELLDLAFLEIAVDGASSPQVARRLLAAYESLASAAPPDLRPAIEERAATLVRLIDATTVEAVRPAARRPDPLGLG